MLISNIIGYYMNTYLKIALKALLPLINQLIDEAQESLNQDEATKIAFDDFQQTMNCILCEFLEA
jgi:hypothetical protein